MGGTGVFVMWRQPGSGQEVARREAHEIGLVLRTAPIPSCRWGLAQLDDIRASAMLGEVQAGGKEEMKL